MAKLVNLSSSDTGREDTFRRRLFPTAPSLCFGRKYADGSGACTGKSARSQMGCSWVAKCRALCEARTAAGVTDLENNYEVPDDYDPNVDFPSSVIPEAAAKSSDLPAKAPKTTTLSPSDQAAIEANIVRIERSVIGTAMEGFLLLGREYAKAHAAMNRADFVTWTKKMGRDYAMAMRYIRWAQVVDRLGDAAKEKIVSAPGITLEKFYAMVGAVGSDHVLELLDVTAKDSHGADVPITKLPVKELRKALAGPEEPKHDDETPDCTSAELTEDPDAAPPESGDVIGSTEYTGTPDVQPKGPFNAVKLLEPLINLSRSWGVNRRDIEGNLAKLDDKQLETLALHLKFLEDVLVPDVRRVLSLLKR